MKVKNVHIQNFKRFTDLTIEGIPETAKMVVLVGPNGCGKTSVFEAFNTYCFGEERWLNKENIGSVPVQPFRYNQPNILAYTKDYYEKREKQETFCDPFFYGDDDIKRTLGFKMYFRTAYRNEDEMSVTLLSSDAIVKRDPILLISNDEKVSINYTKLIYQTFSGVYLEDNNDKSVADLRDKLIGKLQQSMQNIFGDLILNNIQSPLKDGSFYFKKGTVENYHYKNLSSGEKAVFDLLLDLIVNLEDYQDSLFFIDEPEAHIHTKLQGQVVEEIYNLIPDNSQLWITTHSLGVMTKAKELASKNPDSVVFLDFDRNEKGEKYNFDEGVTIKPSSISSTVWKKFMSVALDDIEKQLVSEITIMCEGGSNDPNKITVTKAKENEENNDFDSVIYNKIFNRYYSNISFESVGSCNNLERDMMFTIMSKMLEGKSNIYRLRDKDDATPEEIEEYHSKGVLTTSRRNIEGYLLDNELLEKLIDREVSNEKNNQVTTDSRDEIWQKIKTIKENSNQKHTANGKPKDDWKRVAGDVFAGIKKHVGISSAGNGKKAFLRDVMAPLITSETKVYKEMEKEIIQPILKKAGKNIEEY